VQEIEGIDIDELTRHPKRYISMAASGVCVPIVADGVVVARVVPPESGSVLERLRVLGHVRPAQGRLTDLLPPPPVPPGERPLSEVLAEMRDEERY